MWKINLILVRSHAILLAWLSFLITLLVTFLLWSNAREDAINHAHTRFETSTTDITRKINSRMIIYEQMLQGGIAFLNSVTRMNPQKWQCYITSLDIAEHYPVFQGIGFSQVIPPEELSDHIMKMRTNGFPNYTLKPEGKRDEYHAIIYLEPLDRRNRRAIGYDMFSDPVRHAAMVRARDTAKASLSGKVTLVQETTTDTQAGFLMYVPFYHTQFPPPSVAQRREKLQGFVYAPFRAGDFMNEILTYKDPDIAVKLYSGLATNKDNLLYQSSPSSGDKPLFELVVPIMMYGQEWTIVYQTLPSYETTIDTTRTRLIIFAGLPISFLLLLIFFSFAQTTEQARIMARNMTAEIRVLNEELENMINTAPNPIIIHTEDGTIVKINQAWCDISGYTLEETPTTGIWVDKVYKEQQEKIKSHIRYLFTITQKVDEGEFTFFNKMGAKITWQFSSAPFGYINGKRAVITSAMDVTELKHKDELMLMQSRYAAMGEMIGMIAHQWRQPLALISTIAGTLNLDVMMDEYKKEIFEERLEAICDIAIDLSATITDFRNFFREDKVKEWTTWKELVRESLAIIEPDIKAKNIAIYPIWDEDIPFMTLPRELKQVILNLLKNSEDVLCEKEIPRPQIWIRTSHEDNMICLEIEDNGGGIPEDIIYKVFDPYFSTKMDKDGTGIGLYMSKMIIEQHANGYLKVRNTSLGACFKISLPLIKEVQ